MNRLAAVLFSALLCSAVALCQDSTSTTYNAGLAHTTMHFGAKFYDGGATTGAPYSAEEVDEDDQTLADGTHITQQMPTTKVYRDSMGRTRTERQPFVGHLGMRSGRMDWPTLIEITDPVAHCRYILDPENKIAHRLQAASHDDHATAPESTGVHGEIEATIGTTGTAGVTSTAGAVGSGPVTAARPRASTPAAAERPAVDDPSRLQTTSESLGTETIEGVLAKGTRTTTTYPVGFVGNDRPFATTHESWRSSELKVTILSKSDDPRRGEHTHKLINISTSEPDPALFQPPSGYTVKDETAEFTITWSSQQR